MVLHCNLEGQTESTRKNFEATAQYSRRNIIEFVESIPHSRIADDTGRANQVQQHCMHRHCAKYAWINISEQNVRPKFTFGMIGTSFIQQYHKSSCGVPQTKEPAKLSLTPEALTQNDSATRLLRGNNNNLLHKEATVQYSTVFY